MSKPEFDIENYKEVKLKVGLKTKAYSGITLFSLLASILLVSYIFIAKKQYLIDNDYLLLIVCTPFLNLLFYFIFSLYLKHPNCPQCGKKFTKALSSMNFIVRKCDDCKICSNTGVFINV